MLKKLLFPFFNKGKHKFLTKKWWFRIIISVYILVLVIGAPIIWIKRSWTLRYDCAYNANVLSAANKEKSYEEYLSECPTEFPDFTFTLYGTLIPFIIIHYLIQLIFFKRVVDYIVLGGER